MHRSLKDIDYTQIPEHMWQAVSDYLEYGYEPGGFLEAVLTNNFQFAIKRADPINRKYLLNWVDFCLGELPSAAWGSPQIVYAWMEVRRSLHNQKPKPG